MKKIESILSGFHLIECARYKSNSLPEVLRKLANKQFNKPELEYILLNRYALSHYFVGMLEYMKEIIEFGSSSQLIGRPDLTKDQYDKLFFAVDQNLNEEKGEIKGYGHAHIIDRMNLVKYLGYDYWKVYGPIGKFKNPKYHKSIDIFTNQKPAYYNFIESVYELIKCDPINCVTALWYWENRIALTSELGDYPIILNAFKYESKSVENLCGKDQPFYHLASHIEHDQYHSKYCFDALVSFPEEYAEKVANTIATIQYLFDKFWEDIKI